MRQNFGPDGELIDGQRGSPQRRASFFGRSSPLPTRLAKLGQEGGEGHVGKRSLLFSLAGVVNQQAAEKSQI